MPNVLMIGPSPDAQGGMATVEKNILDAIESRGDRAVFVSTCAEGSKPKKLAVAVWAYIKYLAEIKECDLIHVHMASRGSFDRKRVFMQAAFRRGTPVVLHLHGSEFGVWFKEECTDEKRTQIRDTFGKCSKILVLSEEWREFILNNGICPAPKVAVLHNAVYVPEENVTDYTANNVLFMGRLDVRKSPDVLLKAAQKVLASHPDAQFTFAGDGNVSFYKAMANDFGILGNCRFTGWVTGEAKKRLFQANSIYCLPSKNEGMPMSVLEAMSHGLATLSTPVGGVPQVISDGENGRLFPVDDYGTLSSLLKSLMEDCNTKKKIGEAGRERIASDFGMDSFVSRMIAIYNEVTT